jgi:hypothetical protein
MTQTILFHSSHLSSSSSTKAIVGHKVAQNKELAERPVLKNEFKDQ